MANGTLKVSNIETSSGSGTITIGQSGETITVPSGATLNLSNATQTGVGGANTPAFEAYLSADQTMSDNAVTKIQFNTEVYDDGSGYDNSSNYRFTVPSGEGGTYKFYTTLNFSDNQNAQKIGWRQLYFYKNGSSYAFFYNDNGTAKAISSNFGSGNITLVLSAGDYIEVYAAIGQTDDNSPSITGYSNGKRYSVFGGYKIIR
tara:strand:+ start:1084 stop:1692 length:609 start_codon:yes stop_codon:yes gene_type:complete